MKKMVVAAMCAVMLGWAGVANAVSFLDDTYQSSDATSYHYDLSSQFTSADTVDWAELAVTLFGSDAYTVEITVNGNVFSGTLVELLTLNGENYSETIYGDLGMSVTYYTYYFDVTADLDAAPELDVLIKYDEDPITVGGLLVYGDIAPVPEPTTMLLFGAGVVGLAAASRRRDRRIKLA